jgi:hypothetical protein
VLSDIPVSRRSVLTGVVAAALLAGSLGALLGVGLRRPFLWSLPAAESSETTVRPSPNVIMAVRELARLETTDYHVERVIELADDQVRLFGLLHAKDALLLVAAGDVVAGVDLAKIGEGDVAVDWPNRRARVHLPEPEIFSVAIDNARTHVVTRATDTLATRKEELEGRARSEAESSMRQAALEAGVLARAGGGAERAVRELLRGLGLDAVTFD